MTTSSRPPFAPLMPSGWGGTSPARARTWMKEPSGSLSMQLLSSPSVLNGSLWPPARSKSSLYRRSLMS